MSIFIDNPLGMWIMDVMKFSKYIEIMKLTQSQAAKEIGISRQTLNYIINNKVQPESATIKKIISWSGGAVTFEDLINI